MTLFLSLSLPRGSPIWGYLGTHASIQAILQMSAVPGPARPPPLLVVPGQSTCSPMGVGRTGLLGVEMLAPP